MALPGLALAAGFFMAVRIQCSHCGSRLADSYPFKGGAGVLLWTVNEKCPKCGQILDWK